MEMLGISHRLMPRFDSCDISCATDHSMIAVLQVQYFVLLCEEARDVDCKVSGLTSRVTEVNTVKIRAKYLAELFAVHALPVIQKDGGRVHEHSSLLCDHLCNGGVTVSTPHSRYTGDQVDVTPARVVVEVLLPALRDQQGLFVAVEVYRHKALTVVQNRLIGWTCVGLGCVINGGQLPHTESCYSRSDSEHL